MLHGVFLLAMVAAAAPLVKYLALPALAAVLMTVGWRLVEPKTLWHFMTRAPRDDLIVLLATLSLTVFAELNTAIATGVVLASIFFMHRMAEVAGIEKPEVVTAPDHAPDDQHEALRVMTFRGPLFFGQSTRVADALRVGSQDARVLVLDLAEVPLIDATVTEVLEELVAAASGRGCRVVVAGLSGQPRVTLHRSGLLRQDNVSLAPDRTTAIAKARAILAKTTVVRTPGR